MIIRRFIVKICVCLESRIASIFLFLLLDLTLEKVLLKSVFNSVSSSAQGRLNFAVLTSVWPPMF